MLLGVLQVRTRVWGRRGGATGKKLVCLDTAQGGPLVTWNEFGAVARGQIIKRLVKVKNVLLTLRVMRNDWEVSINKVKYEKIPWKPVLVCVLQRNRTHM